MRHFSRPYCNYIRTIAICVVLSLFWQNIVFARGMENPLSANLIPTSGFKSIIESPATIDPGETAFLKYIISYIGFLREKYPHRFLDPELVKDLITEIFTHDIPGFDPERMLVLDNELIMVLGGHTIRLSVPGGEVRLEGMPSVGRDGEGGEDGSKKEEKPERASERSGGFAEAKVSAQIKNWDQVEQVVRDAPLVRYQSNMGGGHDGTARLFRAVRKEGFESAQAKKAVGPRQGTADGYAWWGDSYTAIAISSGFDRSMHPRALRLPVVSLVFEISEQTARAYNMDVLYRLGKTARDIPYHEIHRVWAVCVDSEENFEKGFVRLAEVTLSGIGMSENNRHEQKKAPSDRSGATRVILPALIAFAAIITAFFRPELSSIAKDVYRYIDPAGISSMLPREPGSGTSIFFLLLSVIGIAKTYGESGQLPEEDEKKDKAPLEVSPKELKEKLEDILGRSRRLAGTFVSLASDLIEKARLSGGRKLVTELEEVRTRFTSSDHEIEQQVAIRIFFDLPDEGGLKSWISEKWDYLLESEIEDILEKFKSFTELERNTNGRSGRRRLSVEDVWPTLPLEYRLGVFRALISELTEEGEAKAGESYGGPGMGSRDNSRWRELWVTLAHVFFSEESNKEEGAAYLRILNDDGELERLKKIKNVISVAFGKRKLEVLTAALRGHIINILLTDKDTAKYILRVK